jgi:hypothetical protein
MRTDGASPGRPGGGALAALAEFVLVAFRPRTPLSRAIVLVLWLKLALVVSLSLYLHGRGGHEVTASDTLNRLLDSSPRR